MPRFCRYDKVIELTPEDIAAIERKLGILESEWILHPSFCDMDSPWTKRFKRWIQTGVWVGPGTLSDSGFRVRDEPL